MMHRSCRSSSYKRYCCGVLLLVTERTPVAGITAGHSSLRWFVGLGTDDAAWTQQRRFGTDHELADRNIVVVQDARACVTTPQRKGQNLYPCEGWPSWAPDAYRGHPK